MPLVSVIVPAYGTAPYIAETLESIHGQSFRDYEVIVVNDGSPDTPELERAIAPFLPRITYLCQEHGGVSAARNRALREASGEYVALLDSDDLWTPDYLDVQVGWMRDEPSIDVLSPNARTFGDSPLAGRTFTEVCPSEAPVSFEALVSYRCQIYGGATIRRSALDQAGGFDPALGSAEDYELWLRLLKQGSRIVCHDRVLAFWRQRRGSITSDPVRLARQAIKMLDKVSTVFVLTPSERDAVREARERFVAHLALAEGKRAFFEGDFRTAVSRLDEANAYYHRTKLTLARHLIRFAPRLLLRAYEFRDRVLVGTTTRF